MTLEDLYKNHYKHFIYKIYPYTNSFDVSEDIVQESFVKAFGKLDQFDQKKGSLKNWFRSVLFSTLWNYKRTLKKIPYSLDIEDYLEGGDFAQFDFDGVEDGIEIENLFHRKILVMYFAFGYTYGEISKILGIGKWNVKKIIQRYRKKFYDNP